MTSKQLGEFLECESDTTILNCQYCIVSSRIRLRSRDLSNTVNLGNILFPNQSVLVADGEEEFDERYYRQLKQHKVLLAQLVLLSEQKGDHVIFLQTKFEKKLGYMKCLRAYIRGEFGCPIYDYEFFTLCTDDDFEPYNREKVIKKCKKIIEKNENKQHHEALQTQEGRERLIKEIEEMSKKKLVKKCKKEGLYREDMTKDDMILALTSFI